MSEFNSYELIYTQIRGLKSVPNSEKEKLSKIICDIRKNSEISLYERIKYEFLSKDEADKKYITKDHLKLYYIITILVIIILLSFLSDSNKIQSLLNTLLSKL